MMSMQGLISGNSCPEAMEYKDLSPDVMDVYQMQLLCEKKFMTYHNRFPG